MWSYTVHTADRQHAVVVRSPFWRRVLNSLRGDGSGYAAFYVNESETARYPGAMRLAATPEEAAYGVLARIGDEAARSELEERIPIVLHPGTPARKMREAERAVEELSEEERNVLSRKEGEIRRITDEKDGEIMGLLEENMSLKERISALDAQLSVYSSSRVPHELDVSFLAQLGGHEARELVAYARRCVPPASRKKPADKVCSNVTVHSIPKGADRFVSRLANLPYVDEIKRQMVHEASRKRVRSRGAGRFDVTYRESRYGITFELSTTDTTEAEHAYVLYRLQRMLA